MFGLIGIGALFGLFLICSFAENSEQSLCPIRLNISWKAFDPSNGTEEGLCPIVLMHGLIGTKEEWDNVAPLIADATKRKVYAFDARNHGDSEFTDSFSADVLVNDLFYFIDSKSMPKAVLIGHSMGAKVAIYAVLRNPERFEAVFIEDMHVKNISLEMQESISQFVEGFARIANLIPKELNHTEAIKHLLDTMFMFVPNDSPLAREKDTLLKVKFILKQTDNGYDVSFNKDVVFRALRNTNQLLKDPVGQFNKTAVFIYGEHSSFEVGSQAAHILEHFPNAHLVEFKNGGHNLHVDFPEQYVQTVVRYLQNSTSTV